MTKDTETLERIRLRCTECGDCWIWNGAMSNGRTPVMSYHGKLTSVRKVMAITHGMRINGKPVSNSCHDSRCVAHEHLLMQTQSQIQKTYSVILGHQRNPVRVKKARDNRKDLILSIEKAREIRQSDKCPEDLAQEYGVAVSTIEDVINYRSWKEFGSASIFSGLIAANNAQQRARA